MTHVVNGFLVNRKQRIVLIGQYSSWVDDIIAGLLQCFILGRTCFSNDLKSMCKLFADETFVFSVFHEVNNSGSDINKDLELIGDWAFEW